MTRRAPAQYAPPAIDFGYLPFDDETLRRILLEARVPMAPDSALLASSCDRLNRAAQLLRVQQRLGSAPTAASERKTLQRISKLASDLRAELPLAYDESLDEADDDPGDNPRVIDGITRLFTPTMTRLMQERVKQERDERGRGPEADEIFGAGNAADAFLVLTELLHLLVGASDIELEKRKDLASVRSSSPLQRFVVEAGQVYLKLSGRKRLPLSRHWDSGKLQGPLVPFLIACCHKVDETKVSPETLAVWVRGARKRG